jgi:hypothetical protein
LSAFHLAGIVPVSGQPLDFKMDWHDCLMPLAPDFTAIERAVLECAWAGCETIWIVANDDVSPLIRHRLGEWINDPVWLGRHQDPFPSQSRKQIPIFYVPVRAKDVGKRDCLAWSVLHGAVTAFEISARLSKWVIPRKNYVAFPYGVYDPSLLRPHRRAISSEEPFMLSCEGQSIQTGEYLGFTFDKEDFINCRREIRKGTGEYTSEVLQDGIYPRNKLPHEERWSARHFSLDKIFQCVIIDREKQVEIPHYYSIDSWDNYCTFLSSDYRKDIVKPPSLILKYNEWNEIGVDDEYSG